MPNLDSSSTFMKMLELPRPSERLKWKFGEVEVNLDVQALNSFEMSQIRDAKENAKAVTLHSAVLLNGKKAFPEKLSASKLSPSHLDALHRSVVSILNEISPTYVQASAKKWMTTLKALAKKKSELFVTVTALGNCVDVVAPGVFIERPDRFFGVPLKDLCDCHWFAYRAAREALKSEES